MTAPTRLTPGVRAYSTGDKSAHIIRTVDDRFAYPWCSDVEGLALLPVVDGQPESPKLAPESMPGCVSCLAVMDPVSWSEPLPGTVIREKRLGKGWTQGDLAEALGATRSVVGNLESGRVGVTAATALLLAEVFDVSALEWLRMQNLVDLERARRCA